MEELVEATDDLTPLDLTRTCRDVSVTERGQFRSCRRRWRLETIDNLATREPQWALSFGEGMHSGLEALYRTRRSRFKLSPLAVAHEQIDKWYEEMEHTLRRDLGNLVDPALDEAWSMRNMGKEMLTNYVEYEKDDVAEDWDVVGIEGEVFGAGNDLFAGRMIEGYSRNAGPVRSPSGRILVPIVNPRTGRRLPGGPYLTARIDLLVLRSQPGLKGLWIVDHKTTASSPSDRGIDFEDQITGYCYVVYRLTGEIPRGVIFNYLVKHTPKEPRMTQKGLSTAKDQLTTAAQYRQALLDEGIMLPSGTITSTPHAEAYAGFLQRGWSPFFKRFEVQRNKHELASFEDRLFEEHKDMREAYKHEHRAYPNPSSWHCPNCSVAPICQAMEDGSDVDGIIASRYTQAPDRKAV